MKIEGLEALGALAKEKGPKGTVATILFVIIMVLIIVSLLKPMEILSEYRETSVTFLGTVYGKEGNRLAGVSVCLEHRPDSVQLTDSEGKYVIMVKSTELPFNYITLCFEHPQFIRITRRFVWKGDFQVYHEIIFQKGG